MLTQEGEYVHNWPGMEPRMRELCHMCTLARRDGAGSGRDAGTERAQERLPPLRKPLLERAQRESVAGCVVLGDRVPAEVLDGHARTVLHRVEAD